MDRRLIGFERGVALKGAEINLQSLAGINFHIISDPRRSHEFLLVHQVLMGLIAWIGVRPWGNRQACTSRRSSSRIYRQLSCSRDDRCPCLAIARARLGLLLVI